MKLSQGVSKILTEGLFYKKTWFKRLRQKNLENRKSDFVYATHSLFRGCNMMGDCNMTQNLM